MIAVLFRGEFLLTNSWYLPPPYSFYGGGHRSRHFWRLVGVRFLCYLNLSSEKYLHVHHQKNILRNTLPDLRPDLESYKNFGLEQSFKIFKNIQKHIPASEVDQGYSAILNLLHY